VHHCRRECGGDAVSKGVVSPCCRQNRVGQASGLAKGDGLKISYAARYTDEALAINARNVAFDWSDVPLEYIPGEPYVTHFWNVMHLVLPEGERAMADVFARALPLIDDERLREEVKGFVGQEATHARSHETFREHLAEGGLDVGRIVQTIAFLMDQVFGDHGLSGRANDAWLRERLGLYAAAEHFTAAVGEWLIDNKNFEQVNMDPTMLDLLRWHGAEEMEHRNVAFDAYQHVDGSYARRVRTALIASVGLAALWMSTSSYLYKNDRASSWRSPWPLQMARGVRRGLIPGLMFFFSQMPQYLNPRFHPSKMGDIDVAVRYLAKSPAARAAG
jgi:uncharacterized protein